MVIVAISSSADVEQNGLYALRSIGVFWASVFSSCAFVLPRLLEVKQANRILMNVGHRQSSVISGLNLSNRQLGLNSTIHDDGVLSAAFRSKSSPKISKAESEPPSEVEIKESAKETPRQRTESKSTRSLDIWGGSNDSNDEW